MRAWLTQNSVPSTRIDYVLTLPDSWEWRAQFLGAFLLLTQPENWEEYGSLSAQEMADEWLELFLLFEELGQPMLPVGTILPFAGVTIPSGFLVCDGSEFDRSDFSDLFDVIGVLYGDGNGTTTANLPFLQGRVPLGYDVTDADFNAIGDFGGQKNVTLEETEMPEHAHTQDSHNHTQDSHGHTQDSHGHTQNSHNHTQDSHNHTFATPIYNQNATVKILFDATGTNIGTGNTPAATATNQAATATNQAATATNQAAGGGQSHNNLQPYLVVNYIIKY